MILASLLIALAPAFAPGVQEAPPAADAPRAELERSRAQATELAREGRFEEAAQVQERSVELARGLASDALLARELQLLGRLRGDAGDTVGALRELEAALAMDERLGHEAGAVQDLELLARLDFLRGAYVCAARRYERLGELAPERVPRVDLAALYVNLGRLERADELLQEALASSRGEPPDRRAHLFGVLASLASTRARYGEAAAWFERALDGWREASGADAELGEAGVLVQLAGLHSELGRFDQAEEALEPAFAILAGEGREPTVQLGYAHMLLGLTRLDAGDPAAALESLELAEQMLSELGHAAGEAEALQHSARARLQLGEAEAALEDARSSLRVRGELGESLGASLSRLVVGEALERLGSVDPATETFAALLRDPHADAQPEVQWRAGFGLARCAERAGDGSRAGLAYRGAFEVLEELRRSLWAPTLRRSSREDRLELYRHGAAFLARSGESREALRWFEALQARTLLELESGEPAPGRASPARARLVAVEQRLTSLEQGLTLALTSNADDATRATLRERLAEERREHGRARMALELEGVLGRRDAALSGLASGSDLEDLRSRLAEDGALVQYLCGQSLTAAWVLRRDGEHWVELPLERERLLELVERLEAPLADLASGRTDVSNLAFDVAAAYELHAALVAPLESALAGATHLWLVPDGPLRRLPFAALVSEHERRPVDPARLYSQYAGCRFLIEDFALGYLPVAGWLALESDGGDELSPLVVADPTPLPAASTVGLARLAGAMREAGLLRSTYRDARLLAGAGATETAVRAALLDAGLVHLGVHGLVDDRRPSFSRLALGADGEHDGWLHAYEVEGLRCEGARVVLAACETLEVEPAGEGLDGLVRAFLTAGARWVVASPWRVDDQATAQLLGDFAARLARAPRRPAVFALREAQLELLRTGRRGPLMLVHPFFWAGFRLVGEG